MFNLFRRRVTPLSKYIYRLEKEENIDFQLDAFRNGNPDFQIIRQRMLQGIDSSVSIENPVGFAIIISFNLKSSVGAENYKRFKKNTLFDSAIELNVHDPDIVFFTIKVDKESTLLLSVVGQLQTEIYGYTDDTYYYFKLKEI